MSPTAQTTPFDVFTCPGGKRHIVPHGGGARCPDTGQLIPRREGFLDFAPDIPPSKDASQMAMESPVIAGIYEDVFRPLFTRLGSDVTYEDEKAYLFHWCRPVDGPILDLACGTGRYLRFLRDYHQRPAIVGLDLSFPMLKNCLKRVRQLDLHNVILARASAETLPHADGSLGAANCFGALHLFPNPAKAIDELARCLQPGGTLTVLTAAWMDGPEQAIQERFSNSAGFRFFHPSELATWLTATGFEALDFTQEGMLLFFTARKV